MTYCRYCRQQRHPDPIPLYTLLVVLFAVLAWALAYVNYLAQECDTDPAPASAHLGRPGQLHAPTATRAAHRMPRIDDAYAFPKPTVRP